MFTNNRDQLRLFYLASWRKYQQKVPLEPLERMVAEVVAEHPEYHELLANEDRALGREYLPEMGEGNPFLHMGLHLSIQEQLTTNRPAGVRELYQALIRQIGDAHQVEHQMIECLAEMLWTAQRAERDPDESNYLDCLKKLVREK